MKALWCSQAILTHIFKPWGGASTVTYELSGGIQVDSPGPKFLPFDAKAIGYWYITCKALRVQVQSTAVTYVQRRSAAVSCKYWYEKNCSSIPYKIAIRVDDTVHTWYDHDQGNYQYEYKHPVWDTLNWYMLHVLHNVVCIGMWSPVGFPCALHVFG